MKFVSSEEQNIIRYPGRKWSEVQEKTPNSASPSPSSNIARANSRGQKLRCSHIQIKRRGTKHCPKGTFQSACFFASEREGFECQADVTRMRAASPRGGVACKGEAKEVPYLRDSRIELGVPLVPLTTFLSSFSSFLLGLCLFYCSYSWAYPYSYSCSYSQSHPLTQQKTTNLNL